ncbi:unnamed protein product [Echinostoma caproni]|uniref:Uncharacterized protein n=1 Tax=Echinostoma caproni TaxID=27848 RepID=A0A183A5P6_9TREM|nr:unnamed protein product [Echinostoma caproni]
MYRISSVKSETNLERLPADECVQPKRLSCPKEFEYVKNQDNVNTISLAVGNTQIKQETNDESKNSLNVSEIAIVLEKNGSLHAPSGAKSPISSTTAFTLKGFLPNADKRGDSTQGTNTVTNNASTKFAKKWKWLLKKYRHHKFQGPEPKPVPGSQTVPLSGKPPPGIIQENTSHTHETEVKQRKASVS